MGFPYYCTPGQRDEALRLMNKLELDPQVVTLMTIRVFHLAGLPPPADGSQLNDAVSTLTRQQCTALIWTLKVQLGETETEGA